jgi:TetR/AcrR family transcriptional repressor of nem operon
MLCRPGFENPLLDFSFRMYILKVIMLGRPIECDRNKATEKAVQHFWRKGYSRSSVADLVEDTGLNRFSIYGEFKGKKGLFLKACQSYSEAARAQLLTPLRESRDPEAGLRRLFANIVTSLLDKSTPAGCLMINTLAENASRDTQVRDILDRHFGAFESAFREALQRAATKAAHPAGVKRGAAILTNTLLGLGYHIRLYPKRKRLQPIIDSAITMAITAARNG